MSTGLGLGGEWRRIVSAIVRGSLLFSVFLSHPSGAQGGEGGVGTGWPQVWGPRGSPRWTCFASSSASVWLSKGRLVEVEGSYGVSQLG